MSQLCHDVQTQYNIQCIWFPPTLCFTARLAERVQRFLIKGPLTTPGCTNTADKYLATQSDLQTPMRKSNAGQRSPQNTAVPGVIIIQLLPWTAPVCRVPEPRGSFIPATANLAMGMSLNPGLRFLSWVETCQQHGGAGRLHQPFRMGESRDGACGLHVTHMAHDTPRGSPTGNACCWLGVSLDPA